MCVHAWICVAYGLRNSGPVICIHTHTKAHSNTIQDVKAHPITNTDTTATAGAVAS